MFKKAVTQFKLLKLLYPLKFEDTESYNNFMLGFKLFRLDFPSIIWMSFPIYYNRIDPAKLETEALRYHFQLVKNRKLFFILFIIYLLWLYGIGVLVLPSSH